MARPALAFLTLAVSVVGLLTASELLLRAAGRTPWKIPYAPRPDDPPIFAPDPLTGWRSHEGRHVFEPYAPEGAPFTVTILPAGARATAPREVEADRELVVVGGSFAMGWAVSDNETLAWRLQERFPELRVVNWATAGYGTYQSLLVLERELPRLRNPELVLYGFTEHHRERNVATGRWLRLLGLEAHRDLHGLPYVSLGERGELVRHPPLLHHPFPLRGVSATAAFAEELHLAWQSRHREEGKTRVTRRLLAAMDRVSADHGAELAVVLLDLPSGEEASYGRFLGARGIPAIDCVRPLTPELQVPGDGHPNGRLHGIWAECIAEALAEQRLLAPQLG